jgi:hypothetical protein
MSPDSLLDRHDRQGIKADGAARNEEGDQLGAERDDVVHIWMSRYMSRTPSDPLTGPFAVLQSRVVA